MDYITYNISPKLKANETIAFLPGRYADIFNLYHNANLVIDESNKRND